MDVDPDRNKPHEEFIFKSAEVCRQVNDHFRVHGATRLDEVEVLLDGMSTHKVIWQSHSSYLAHHRSLPFVLAVCHDFSTLALAKIVRHFSIDPVTFIQGFDCWVDAMRSLSGKFLDSAVFHQKMVEAFTAIDPVSAKALFSSYVGVNSYLNHAFLVAGDSHGVVDQLLEDEYQAASCDQAPVEHSLQAGISKDAWQISDNAHLPNGSTGEYLVKTGALNRHVNQKTLSLGSYWESFFAQASHDHADAKYCNALLRSCLSGIFANAYKNELSMALSNLAMDSTYSFFELNDFLKNTLQVIEGSDFSEFSAKATLKVALLRNQIRYGSQQTDLDTFSDQNQIVDTVALDMISSLATLQSGFLQRMIDETLAVPDEWMGFHLLTLPCIVKNIVLPEQTLSQQSFEAYLQKMARCATQFKLPGVVPNEKRDMDEMIDQGMAHWVNQIMLSHSFDLSSLDFSDARVNEQLIFWGVNIQHVPTPSEKAMEFALGRDLGL